MVHTTWRSDGTVTGSKRFLIRRLARIWPVYLVHTALFLLLFAGHKGLPGDTAEWWKVLRGLLFYPQQAGDEPFFGYPPLGVGWTLNYEVWFYLLFGASMLAGKRRWLVFFAALAFFLIVLPLALTGRVRGDAFGSYGVHHPLLAEVMNPMIWDFGAGVLIGIIYRSRFRVRPTALRLGLVALTSSVVIWQYVTRFHEGHGPARWGGPIACLVLALALQHKQRPIWVPRPLLWLGEISFSLYLVQRLPQMALMSRFRGAHEAFFHTIAWFWLGSLLAILLAWVSYVVLERGLAERVRVWLLARLT
jgi:exopolysaccharide production protein ExoZ